MKNIMTYILLLALLVAPISPLIMVTTAQSLPLNVTISPVIVSNSSQLPFTITITNNATSSLYYVEIKYPKTVNVDESKAFRDIEIPTGWVIDSHNTTEGLIVLRGTGGYLLKPNSTMTIRLILNVTKCMSDYAYFNLTMKDTNEVSYINQLRVLVDAIPPKFDLNVLKINDVPYIEGMIVNGDKINITGKAFDPDTVPSGLKPQSLIINDTRFIVEKFNATDGSFTIKGVQPISGWVSLRLTVYDNANNWVNEAIKFYADIDVPVINEVKVTYNDNPASLIGNTFWIPGTGNYTIKVIVNVSDVSLDTNITKSYLQINKTLYSASFEKKDGYYIATVQFGLLTTDPPMFNITVQATDTFGYVTTATYYVRRDMFPPLAPVYESVQGIGSGLIIRGLAAEDVGAGVKGFNIYVNGTLFATIGIDDYIETGEDFWDNVIDSYLNEKFVYFNNRILLNLAAYRGKYVVINVSAIDWTGNEGPKTKLFEGKLPDTYWYPVPLYPGWNLITPPLATVAVKDLVNTEFTIYMYNSTTMQWSVLTSPNQMRPGVGYWYASKDYSILIIEGYPQSLPGQLPVHFYLEKGWNIIGVFGMGDTIPVTEYLGSLQEKSYYPVLFGWDPYYQSWRIIDARSETATLRYGEAIYIYMYSQQVLIPPTC